jgi:hypothetical protein
MELYLNANTCLYCVLHNRAQRGGGGAAAVNRRFWRRLPWRAEAVVWVSVTASCIGGEPGVKICTSVLECIGCMGVELGLSY